MSRNQAEDKKKLLVQLKKTPIVQVACERNGLPRSTYYRWRKDDEDFAVECDIAIEESTAFVNDMAESQLIRSIKDCNLRAIIFWLKNHHKAYKNKVEVEAKVRSVAQELTPEQKVIVSEALKLSGLTTEKENENEQ